jgi:hypothetical protein
MRKIIHVAFVALFLLSATPAFAQLYGTWAGSGDGYCFPPDTKIIYPWQNWKGTIPDPSSGAKFKFTGEWYDELGNSGRFVGSPVPSIPEVTAFRGTWYWYDPSGASDPVYGGDFEMIFYFMKGYCKGTWTTIWPTPYKVGTMKGERVGPDDIKP